MILLFVYHGFCTGGTNFSKHRREAIELALQQHLRILSAWMPLFLPTAYQSLGTETKAVFFLGQQWILPRPCGISSHLLLERTAPNFVRDLLASFNQILIRMSGSLTGAYPSVLVLWTWIFPLTSKGWSEFSPVKLNTSQKWLSPSPPASLCRETPDHKNILQSMKIKYVLGMFSNNDVSVCLQSRLWV